MMVVGLNFDLVKERRFWKRPPLFIGQVQFSSKPFHPTSKDFEPNQKLVIGIVPDHFSTERGTT